MELIETPDASIIGALSIARRTNSGTWTIQRTSLAFAIIRTFVTELRAKYFLTVPLKAVEAKLGCIFRHAFVFKAAFYHRFCHNRCLIIGKPCYIVLEVTAALSPIFYKYTLALT
jgi:hypothetical protein